MPRDVGPGSLSAPAMPMRDPVPFGFCCKASTGLGVSGTQVIGINSGMTAAITITKVFRNLSAGFVDSVGAFTKHFKSSKVKSDQGYFLRHGISIFNVMFSIGRRYMPLTDAKTLMNPAM